MAAFRECDLDDLLQRQHGVLSRRQALDAGMTAGRVRAELAARRWQKALPGVYVTFTGPLPQVTRVWVALLHAGEGAMASHETAAWLHGLLDAAPWPVHVLVPACRRVRSHPGVAVHLSRSAPARRHPAADPPRTRIEDTVLDLVDAARRPHEVVDLVTRACQRRLTTAARLRTSAAQRPRLRWRLVLMSVLGEVVEGVQSELERRFAADVERAHGLPKGDRNLAEDQEGQTVHRDVRYRGHGVVVELDGRAAHPVDLAHLDRARDRFLAARDVVTVRFGWREVAGDPCAVAAEMAVLLRARGWRGLPRRCGPRCRAAGCA